MLFTKFSALRFNDPTADLTPGGTAHATAASPDGVMHLDDVIAPLSAVEDATTRNAYAESNDYNVANLINASNEVWDQWRKRDILMPDPEPVLYLYRIGFSDALGNAAQVSGVVGENPRHGVDNRLSIGVVLVAADGFSDLLTPSGMPLARATDDAGRHHRLWAITQTGVQETVIDAVVKHGRWLDAHAPTSRAATTSAADVEYASSIERSEPALIFATEATSTITDPYLGMLFAP